MDPLTEAEVPEVVAYLEQRPERAMFPLSNLRSFGLTGTHPYTPRLWVQRGKAGIEGALVILRNHMVMPLCDPELTLKMLKGRQISAMMGPTEHTRPVAQALGLSNLGAETDSDEPQYALDLADLRIPDGPGALVPLEAADKDEMVEWRTAYMTEALGMPPGEAAQKQGAGSYARYIANDTHRVLMDGDTALATTGFNATLPHIVQIGGVYTPPDKRGRGHARRAVALHLDEARQNGVTRATLFAANAAAQRAYEAIGFRHIGSWTLILLPEVIYV